MRTVCSLTHSTRWEEEGGAEGEERAEADEAGGEVESASWTAASTAASILRCRGCSHGSSGEKEEEGMEGVGREREGAP